MIDPDSTKVLPRRILASLIDLGIVILPALLILKATVITYKNVERNADGSWQPTAQQYQEAENLSFGNSLVRVQEVGDSIYIFGGLKYWMGLFFILLLALLVFVLLPARTGASPGKHLTGLRVVGKEGEPATLSQYITRTVVGIVDFPIFGALGWIVASNDVQTRRIGDRVAGTLVVDAREQLQFVDEAAWNRQREALDNPLLTQSPADLDSMVALDDRLGRRGGVAVPQQGEQHLHMPDVAMPDVAMPDVAMPDVAMPDVGMPDVGMPTMAAPSMPTAAAPNMPDVATPAMDMLDVGMPDVAMPDVGMPDVAMPDVAMPDVGMPDVAMPDVAMPDVGMPDVGMPDVATPAMDMLDVGMPTAAAPNVELADLTMPDLTAPDMPDITAPEPAAPLPGRRPVEAPAGEWEQPVGTDAPVWDPHAAAVDPYAVPPVDLLAQQAEAQARHAEVAAAEQAAYEVAAARAAAQQAEQQAAAAQQAEQQAATAQQAAIDPVWSAEWDAWLYWDASGERWLRHDEQVDAWVPIS